MTGTLGAQAVRGRGDGIPSPGLLRLERDPQVVENGYIVEMEHPEAGKVKMLAPPVAFSDTPTRPLTPAPQFGQNTEELLLEHGYSWEEIATFREGRVI